MSSQNPLQPRDPSVPAGNQDLSVILARRFLTIMAGVLPRVSSEDVVLAATAPTDGAFLRALVDMIAGKAASSAPECGASGERHTDAGTRGARLVCVVARAVEALGDPERAGAWLVSPNRALGGRTPVALLDSDEGAAEVEAVLIRIEHGVVG